MILQKGRKYAYLFMLCVLCVLVASPIASNGNAVQDGEGIIRLRDSLDVIQYIIPTLKKRIPHRIIIVKNQRDWDSVGHILENLLISGDRNIIIDVRGKNIEFGDGIALRELYYPDANIRIIGTRSFIRANYNLYLKGSAEKSKGFYVYSYSSAKLGSMFLDANGNEVPLRDPVFMVDSKIEDVKEYGNTYFKRFGTDLTDSIARIWRFPVSLPDLSEEDCQDFYILLTRDWISCRHKVYKVEDGLLYFYMNSPDFMSSVSPNCDREKYNVHPRVRFINCPTSKGLHYKNDKLYVPLEYKSIRVVDGYRLLTLLNCVFNSFEISGFNINGCGDGSVIDISNCRFIEAMFIRNNKFSNLSNLAIQSLNSENVCVTGNTINNTRIGAIYCTGKNTTINRNHLQNIGWMLNTRAIIGGGEKLHICDNIIEDFYYAAITTGNSASNEKAAKLTYIIERNLIRQNIVHTDNYLSNSLADGGGLYIGPQCCQGIIRHNVVLNMKGIYSNRGIFLDDGAKNLSVYGNMVCNTSNCYDIDLRLSSTYAKGIPDHNCNNAVFNNILAGGYRFQDAGSKSNCIGGQNARLGLSSFLKYDVSLSNQAEDLEISECLFENDKLYVPHNKESLLDSLQIDRFVRSFIELK